MQRFGEYQTQRPRDLAELVWSASKANDPAAKFILKFRPVSMIGEEGARLFRLSAELQQKIASQSRYWAPIYEIGVSDGRAYYVTDNYRWSASLMIESRPRVDDRVLTRLASSVAIGLTDYKSATGRPHGNLKPTNILMSGQDLHEDGVWIVLADPSADIGGAQVAANDRRGLGKLIYQLVHGTEFKDYYWPLQTSEKWSGPGLAGTNWRERCNGLLAPPGYPQAVEVEQLLAEMSHGGRSQPNRPRTAGSPRFKKIGMFIVAGTILITGSALLKYFGVFSYFSRVGESKMDESTVGLSDAVTDSLQFAPTIFLPEIKQADYDGEYHPLDYKVTKTDGITVLGNSDIYYFLIDSAGHEKQIESPPKDVGKYEVVVQYRGGSGYASAKRSETFTINPANAPSFLWSMIDQSYVYSGDSQGPTASIEGLARKSGQISMQYFRGADLATAKLLAGVPKDAGHYWAVATYKSNDNNFTDKMERRNFTIEKAKPRFSFIYKDWPYDTKPHGVSVTLHGNGDDEIVFVKPVYHKGPATGPPLTPDEIPTEQGTYTAVASFGGSENYLSDEEWCTYKISGESVVDQWETLREQQMKALRLCVSDLTNQLSSAVYLQLPPEDGEALVQILLHHADDERRKRGSAPLSDTEAREILDRAASNNQLRRLFIEAIQFKGVPLALPAWKVVSQYLSDNDDERFRRTVSIINGQGSLDGVRQQLEGAAPPRSVLACASLLRRFDLTSAGDNADQTESDAALLESIYRDLEPPENYPDVRSSVEQAIVDRIHKVRVDAHGARLNDASTVLETAERCGIRVEEDFRADTRFDMDLKRLKDALSSLPPDKPVDEYVKTFRENLNRDGVSTSRILQSHRELRQLLEPFDNPMGSASGPRGNYIVETTTNTDPNLRKYRLTFSAEDQQILCFRKLERADGSSFYLCTTEMPVGLYIDLIQKGDIKIAWRLMDITTDDTADAMPAAGVYIAKICAWHIERDPITQSLTVAPSNSWVGDLPHKTDFEPPLGNMNYRPDKMSPMGYVTPAAGAYVGALLGCRLPTEDEWKTAMKSNLTDDKPNLRGNATRNYIRGIQALGQSADDLNDLLGFNGDNINALCDPQDSKALNEVLWFRDVPGESQNFVDLDSNFSQWASKPGTSREEVMRDTSKLPTADTSLHEFSSHFERLGRSTLSPAKAAPDVTQPPSSPTDSHEFHDRYPDVGFRLAFDADQGDVDPKKTVLTANFLPLPPQ